MTWTRLGDNFYDRADLGRVSRSARLLFVELLVYCNRELLDGAFPAYMLRRICDDPDSLELVAELEAAGLVTASLERDVLHVDWTDQEDAETVRARHSRNADRQKRYRLRKELHAAGDHSQCDPRFCNRVTGNATGNETGIVTPSLPHPSLPVPKGQGQGGGTGPASADAQPAGAAGEAATRLRLAPHPWTGECCALPDEHPIHQVREQEAS